MRGGYDVSRREVISTFLRKSIFERAPEQARAELLQTLVGEMADFWQALPVPRISIFGFDVVVAQFPVVINAPFDAIVEAAAATLGGTRGRLDNGSFAPRGAPLSFGNRVREVIISAGQSRRMVELTYDGYSDHRVRPPYAQFSRPPREKVRVLFEMIRRPEGATLEELATTLGNQPHTVRATISVKSREQGLNVECVGGRYFLREPRHAPGVSFSISPTPARRHPKPARLAS